MGTPEREIRREASREAMDWSCVAREDMMCGYQRDQRERMQSLQGRRLMDCTRQRSTFAAHHVVGERSFLPVRSVVVCHLSRRSALRHLRSSKSSCSIWLPQHHPHPRRTEPTFPEMSLPGSSPRSSNPFSRYFGHLMTRKHS